jgi:hypothetical protein
VIPTCRKPYHQWVGGLPPLIQETPIIDTSVDDRTVRTGDTIMTSPEPCQQSPTLGSGSVSMLQLRVSACSAACVTFAQLVALVLALPLFRRAPPRGGRVRLLYFVFCGLIGKLARAA